MGRGGMRELAAHQSKQVKLVHVPYLCVCIMCIYIYVCVIPLGVQCVTWVPPFYSDKMVLGCFGGGGWPFIKWGCPGN